MKGTFLQEDFIKLLSVVNRIIGIKQSLPLFSNVFIEAKEGFLTLKTTNLEISISSQIAGKIDEEGSLLCSSRFLLEYVNLLEAGKIELSTENKNLVIKSQESQAKIASLESADFPTFPILSSETMFSLPKEILLSLVKRTSFAVANDPNRPILGGILLKKKEERMVAVSTDGFRLSEVTFPLPKEKTFGLETLIIPARALLEITHLIEGLAPDLVVDFRLTQDQNQLGVLVDSYTILSRLLEADYPPYEKIIPQDFATEATFERSPLLKAVRTVAVFSPKEGSAIKLNLKEDGEVFLSAENKESGQGQTALSAQVKGKEVSLVFNSKFLLDALNSFSDERVRFLIKDSFTPAVLNGEKEANYRHLIMPIRLG